jgi:hypothetical protein
MCMHAQHTYTQASLEYANCGIALVMRIQIACCWGYEREKKHTTGGIPRWSPTLVLVARFSAYVWQSGRDA